MSIGRKGTGTVAALAAALVLVLQSVFGAAAMGAGPIQRDIFGNAICIGGEAQHNPENGPDGGHLPDCCTLGCSAFAQFPADTANAADDLIPIITAVAATAYPSRNPHPSAGERRPANPRAPPFAA